MTESRDSLIHSLGRVGGPHYYADAPGKRGRKAKPVETMLRMYLLQDAANLLRADDEVVYADAGYQGIDRRPEVTGEERLSQVEFRVAARKGRLRTMSAPDRAAESRRAAVRAKVEHPFLIIKRDFGFAETRYRGLAKNRNHLQALFASAHWLMRARAVALMG